MPSSHHWKTDNMNNVDNVCISFSEPGRLGKQYRAMIHGNSKERRYNAGM